MNSEGGCLIWRRNMTDNWGTDQESSSVYKQLPPENKRNCVRMKTKQHDNTTHSSIKYPLIGKDKG